MESEETSGGKVRFLVNVAYWTVIIAIIYIVFRYLLRLLMPFFLALVFASVVRPIAYHLSRETKLVKDENGKMMQNTSRLMGKLRRILRINWLQGVAIPQQKNYTVYRGNKGHSVTKSRGRKAGRQYG